ncbi:hypothetical protein Cpin_6635 [Chitinophaga pinensis DSM 2588]|uniref:Uncharacterized protein n=1 Tax=Chitinophaga pinensis (strain ATCC 43595 / DSM 2588 / LMG 13176 / NBRC 15968 / NCIMB 11800 / UQM 2034) TaxID=485918 RepID=A0A979GZJ2_CHIPD|nr:hypothetical protein Cpin_6635 [Chitinophaga pinensis DSM 2588]
MSALIGGLRYNPAEILPHMKYIARMFGSKYPIQVMTVSVGTFCFSWPQELLTIIFSYRVLALALNSAETKKLSVIEACMLFNEAVTSMHLFAI